MSCTRAATVVLIAAAPFVLPALSALSAQRHPQRFAVEEVTIAQIHAAMRAGTVTCRELVDIYRRRIVAFDKTGPALNAIVQLNTAAVTEAADLDRRFKSSGAAGPLHCIPAIVKDNFETIGLQSAAGSLALKGFVSHKDAFQVRRLKDAGPPAFRPFRRRWAIRAAIRSPSVSRSSDGRGTKRR